MQLLAPVFLAGLGLLIVPLAIHLTQRRRREVDPFPSLMFLRRVPFRTSSRRRIRHPLLFALRCLGIVLIVLASPILASALVDGATSHCSSRCDRVCEG